MANEQIIDEVVSPAVKKQISDLQAQLSDLDKQFIDTAKSANALNVAVGNSRTYREYQQNAERAAVAQERVQQAQNRTAITANQLAASTQRLQAQQERATAATQKQSGEYAKLVAAYNAATLAARNAGAQFGTSSQQYIQAAQSVNSLRTQLDAINEPIGRLNSIGNIFGKLFGYVRTLAYILPGIGIAGIFSLIGEGLLKAVEYLGLFNDKITTAAINLKNFNDVAKTASEEAGKQSSNLKILYQAATDVNNSYQDRIRAAQELKKEFPGAYKNDSDLAIITGELSDKTKDLSSSLYDLAKARAIADKLGEIQGQKFDVEVQQQKIRNAQANEEKRSIDTYTKALKGQNMTLEQARVAASKATFEQAKYEKQVRNSVLATKVSASDPRGANTELNEIRARANDAQRLQQERAKQLDENEKFLLKIAGGNNKIAKALSSDQTGQEKDKKTDLKSQYEEQLKALKLAEDAILQSDKSSYEDRLKAVNDYYNDAYDLTTKYSRLGVLTQQKTNNKLTEFDIDTAKDRKKIQEDAQKELAKLIKDGLKDQEDAERASIEQVQKAGDDRVLVIEQNSADAQAALANQYAAGLITQKQYQKQLTAIQDQADIDRLDQEIITTNAIIELRKGLLLFGIGSGKELQTAEDKLAKQKLERVKAGTKAVLDGIQEEAQARQQLHDKEKQLGDASLGLIQTVVDAGYAKQLQALEDLSKQVDDNATKEKDANNATLQSTKDKADKNAIIDAKALQQKQQIAQQEKDIRRKQAEFDRAVSIARIIEETAIGVVQALTIPIVGFALSAVIAAIGAVQIATVLATPLPSFKDGGTTPGGHVLWGEAGTELATLPDGSQQISTGPTVQAFPRGTKITPHNDLMRQIKPDKVGFVGGQEVPWTQILEQLKKNEPKKQSKAPIKININGDFDRYRKSYFK